MGDSDDEYDRKRRDKFRGERTEGYPRESRRGSTEGRREDWPEREGSWGGGRAIPRPPRGDYREYTRARERYSPVPPIKRFKPEAWDDRRYGSDYPPYGSAWGHDFAPPERSYPPVHRRVEREPAGSSLDTQPAMMSFKSFLGTQDDTITDQEAISKYNEYKLDFKRLQLNEFFVAHKDEEWFKIKYHPEISFARKDEQLNFVKTRLEVFMEFMKKGMFDEVRLDADMTEQLVQLMDRIVIRLEGGDESDWLSVENDDTAVPVKPKETEKIVEKPVVESKEEEKMVEDVEKVKDAEVEQNGNVEKEPDAEPEPEKEAVKPEEPVTEANGGAEQPKSSKRKRESDSESGCESDEEKSKKTDEQSNPGSPASGSVKETQPAEKTESAPSPSQNDSNDPEIVEIEPKRKDLHKTASVFLRTLAPSITKSEVEIMCRRYPGFLRVALAEPQYERRWFRRGWVTFMRHVNIKEICWNLNNIRLRDSELGAIVNKDLTRRVRTVAGVASHKQVVRNDIKIAARMTHTLDLRNALWGESESDETNNENNQSFGLVSSNPILENITDYLIEEASAEEEELLGLDGENSGQVSECTVERDDTLIRVLDRLLLYLRIVFSIDYYNHCEYPQEDEMPNRCGLIHVRGPPPSTKVSQQEIQDYCKQFEAKISSLVTPNNLLGSSDLVKLGAKNSDKEVEKFIQSNTQELQKDKWLCPLSGKKFKGPDFVRKHIQNKHAEKVQEVIKEVEYFNNYLADPRRPMLPEHPGSKAPAKREPDAYSAPPREPSYAPPLGGYGFPPRGGYGGYGGYGGFRGMRAPYRGRGGGGGGGGGGGSMPVQDFRPVIHYRDLDAPREPDEFI